jgi:mannosyltransferase OCH1-like enzyme
MRISEYIGYLKHFGLIYTLREIYYRFFSNILEKRIYLKRDKDTLNYLKRYFNTTANFSPCYKLAKDLKPCIWTCWLQGYDNAPPIVKACINSMKKYAGDYEVIIITEETIADYVSMPDFIIKKYEDGIIPVAHFTDLLRTLLLINYGGIWLDATVLLTKNIPSIVLNSDFFVFQSSILNTTFQPSSNWFIAARKNNPILTKIFEILLNYWEKNNYLIHYFMFHIAIQLVITHDKEAKSLWHDIFYKNNSDPHILQKKLFDALDPNMRAYIWDLSFAHKLTYKFSDKSLTEHPGTYYQYIIKMTEKP